MARMPDLEKILYYDIDLDDPSSQPLRKAIKDSLLNKTLLHMKFSFIGNDIKTEVTGDDCSDHLNYPAGD